MNSHYERNIIEILKRLNDVEKKIDSAKNNKTTVSYGTTSHQSSGNDHRLLTNLNSEDYMHLTGDEYRSIVVGVGDHGGLTGLLDNDHPQYIRHSIAGYEWDMLAAETNPISGQLTFVRKGIDDVRDKLVADGIFPDFLVIDTTNERFGIGVQPDTAFHVDGTATIANGNLILDSDKTPVISSDIDMMISASNGVFLNSSPVGVVLSSGTNMRSETFAQDVYGWSVENSGDAFFRNVKVNKINARIVSTGVEQYVGGRQTMCKSASPLTNDFTVPAPGGTSILHVEPFADYPYIHVFSDGDIVRLLHVSLYDGKYNTNDCWGTVVFSLIGSPREQTYTFTRSTDQNSGSCRVDATIPAGELVLNFGISGDGYIVSTVV